jgi:Tat protein translocase TatB subunit
MSGIGFSELVILFAIGLIVLGPERLPRVANQLGRWIGQARRMTRVMKRQLEDELDFDKDFDINPPAHTQKATPGTYKPPVSPPAPLAEEHDAEELDDSYSPAHDADSVGTGVGSDADVAQADAEPASAAETGEDGKERV